MMGWLSSSRKDNFVLVIFANKIKSLTFQESRFILFEIFGWLLLVNFAYSVIPDFLISNNPFILSVIILNHSFRYYFNIVI